MKNKEELPTNLDRGALPQTFDFRLEREPKPLAKLLRPESTDPASDDQPALSVSLDAALMELIVAPRNLERAWRQVKRNRGAPGPDGMTIKQFEGWARENWPVVRQQLLDGTYRPAPVRRRPTYRSVPDPESRWPTNAERRCPAVARNSKRA